jgi:hypothetical protein
MEISRWRSAAQPPEQIKGDISRPGRDAGLALIGQSKLVLRSFRARLAPCAIPVASAPANISSASGAEGFASSIGSRRFVRRTLNKSGEDSRRSIRSALI